MAFRLTLCFGGLCLFVPRYKKDNGRSELFVLMPSTAGLSVKEHVPVLRYDSRYRAGTSYEEWNQPGAWNDTTLGRAGGGDRGVLNFDGQLADNGDHGMPGTLAPACWFANSPVNAAHFTSDPAASTDPNAPLAVRIELGVGQRVEPFGERADLVTTVASQRHEGWYVGQSRITTEVAADRLELVSGVRLEPCPYTGDMELILANVPRADFATTPQPINPNQRVAHFDAYYKLLESQQGPDVRAGAHRRVPNALFVDPYRCTNAVGWS